MPPVPTKRQRTVGPVARQNQLLELACHYLNNEQSQPQAQSDNTPAIAKAWGEKLLTLEGTQRIYAEKAINDVLFEASFGNLDRNSVSITIKKSRNSPSVSDSYFPSSFQNAPFNNDELFTPVDVFIEEERDRIPCGNDIDDQLEATQATGTADKYVTGATDNKLQNSKALNDGEFLNPGNTIKQEMYNAVNSQSNNIPDAHATSSAGNIQLVESGEMAVDASTSHKTVYGDTDTVYAEELQDPITVPINVDEEFEITEIIENDISYQQPFMFLLPNPHMSGHNEYTVLSPDNQPTDIQEMENSSNINKSLTTYFQNFTE